MKLINFEELRSYAINQSFSSPNFQKLYYAMESLQESSIVKELLENEHAFYPKYLWHEDKDLELIFFTNENLCKFTYEEDGFFNFRTRFLKDITKIELIKVNPSRSNVELNLIFTDGEVFTFTSNDSNNSWKPKFYKAILEIFKKLQ